MGVGQDSGPLGCGNTGFPNENEESGLIPLALLAPALGTAPATAPAAHDNRRRATLLFKTLYRHRGWGAYFPEARLRD
jgi:hypothetical protein